MLYFASVSKDLGCSAQRVPGSQSSGATRNEEAQCWSQMSRPAPSSIYLQKFIQHPGILYNFQDYDNNNNIIIHTPLNNFTIVAAAAAAV